MTNQEAYDIVSKHLLSSKTIKSSGSNSSNDMYGTHQRVCFYNGPNGSHCAIGILLVGIPITEDENSVDVGMLCQRNKLARGRLKDIDFGLLRNLQKIHDAESNWMSYIGDNGVSRRKSALAETAKMWRLNETSHS